MAEWRLIETCDALDGEIVDLWLDVPAGPRLFGIADHWKIEGWREDGKWFDKGGLLEHGYVTHWAQHGTTDETGPLTEMETLTKNLETAKAALREIAQHPGMSDRAGVGDHLRHIARVALRAIEAESS